jgi:ribosome-interacting GTPase 1
MHTQVKQTVLTKELVATILREYKVMHAEVILKEDCTEDDFIDVLEGMRP